MINTSSPVDVTVKVSSHGDRISRSTDLPSQLLVSLNISNDQITYDLTENEEISWNVPIYTADTEGAIIVEHIASSGVGL